MRKKAKHSQQMKNFLEKNKVLLFNILIVSLMVLFQSDVFNEDNSHFWKKYFDYKIEITEDGRIITKYDLFLLIDKYLILKNYIFHLSYKIIFFIFFFKDYISKENAHLKIYTFTVLSVWTMCCIEFILNYNSPWILIDNKLASLTHFFVPIIVFLLPIRFLHEFFIKIRNGSF